MSSGDWSDPRPMAPHLQVWKPHLTMIASITHRFTGMALYFGSFLIAIWVFALGMTPQAGEAVPGFYRLVETAILSIPGQVVLVLWAAAVLYHLANGIRHLLWDGPRVGFRPGVASAVSMLIFLFAGLGAVALWAAARFL